MLKILIATKNKKKKGEIKDLLKYCDVRLIDLNELKNVPDIEEHGKTFKENAILKALGYAQFSGMLTLAEDSGLEVAALKWCPGVYSARYSGKAATDKKNNAKLLRELKDKPLSKRRARYRCAVAMALPGKVIKTFEGRCSGVIGLEPIGSAGFGYDPLFIIPQYKKTFAQLGLVIKHKISHRARAFENVREYLKGRKAL